MSASGYVRCLSRGWGGERIVGRGSVRVPADLAAFVARDGSERVGVLTYVVEGDGAEIVTLDALREGSGVGRSLPEAFVATARSAQVRRLLVMTTNDNLRAPGLYQRAGFCLIALRPGAVDLARQTKLRSPSRASRNPIHDELDLALELQDAEPQGTVRPAGGSGYGTEGQRFESSRAH